MRIDHVVVGNLRTAANIAPAPKLNRFRNEALDGIRVTAVVEMPIRIPHQEDPVVRIGAVLQYLTLSGVYGHLDCDLSDEVVLADEFALADR